MNITHPIPGLDNFMVIDTNDGRTLRAVFEQSTKFQHVARPGAQHKVLGALDLDFIVRAKDDEGARELIESVWG